MLRYGLLHDILSISKVQHDTGLHLPAYNWRTVVIQDRNEIKLDISTYQVVVW
jgi:hypothetical protein